MKPMIRSSTAVVLAMAASSGFAQAASEPPSPSVAQAASAPDAQWADGEVRKIDKEAGKLTLRHGPIASLDMPAMTMIFRVSDAAMLDDLKVGDKVRFESQNVNGALTVTRIEMSR